MGEQNSNEYVWVTKARNGGRGYFRRMPVTAGQPTPAQAAQRLRLSILANMLPGAKGVAEQEDGRRIPVNAALLAPLLKGSPETAENGADHPIHSLIQTNVKKETKKETKKEVKKVVHAPL